MAVYAVKRGDESNDAVQKRFKQQVQKLGHLPLLRDRSRFKKKPNKRIQRMRAISRERNRSRNRRKQFYSNM